MGYYALERIESLKPLEDKIYSDMETYMKIFFKDTNFLYPIRGRQMLIVKVRT